MLRIRREKNAGIYSENDCERNTPRDVIHIFLIPEIGDAIIPYKAPDEDEVNCIREPGGDFWS